MSFNSQPVTFLRFSVKPALECDPSVQSVDGKGWLLVLEMCDEFVAHLSVIACVGIHSRNLDDFAALKIKSVKIGSVFFRNSFSGDL